VLHIGGLNKKMRCLDMLGITHLLSLLSLSCTLFQDTSVSEKDQDLKTQEILRL
jgi:hypothetical protein